MNRMRTTICCATLLALASVVGIAADDIHPSPIPISWELTFKATPPMRIVVDTGKGLTTYWYVLYTVINNTNQDVDFHPEIVRVNEIETDLTAEQAKNNPGKASCITTDDAIVGVHPKVFEAIKNRYAKTHPFLTSPVEAIGRLLQGRDNARTSVAIFRDPDPRVSKFTVYVGGLSGETKTVPNPRYDPKRAAEKKAGDKNGNEAPDDNPEFFVLRKTLAMPYALPGDLKTRRSATPKPGPITWVMR